MVNTINLASLQRGTFGTTNDDVERHRCDIPLSENTNVDNCSHTPEKAMYFVNFLGEVTLDTIDVRMYEKDNRTYTFHVFESTVDGKTWTELLPSESTKKGAFKINFAPRRVSQIRMSGKNTSDAALHIVRFQAYGPDQ